MGETENAAVDRVRPYVKEMQAQMTSSEDLTQ
jgi:hypothetical protein